MEDKYNKLLTDIGILNDDSPDKLERINGEYRVMFQDDEDFGKAYQDLDSYEDMTEAITSSVQLENTVIIFYNDDCKITMYEDMVEDIYYLTIEDFDGDISEIEGLDFDDDEEETDETETDEETDNEEEN